MRKITKLSFDRFKNHLLSEEKSDSTIEKCISDLKSFAVWLGNRNLEKTVVLEYKKHITGKYLPSSVNSIISSLNSFFSYNEWFDCKVKTLKIQKKIFSEKELSKQEYERLLRAAQASNNQRLMLVMQTICSCGIRVSELKYITVEAIRVGKATINCKGKMRVVMLTTGLCKILAKYIKEQKITNGSIFVTKNGKPLDRSNIWADMKKLCERAGVMRDKVFPHNLRHLFARTYYSLQKDIVRLADILGHSNINTTRIYTIENGEVHRRQLQKLGLLLC